MVPQVRAFRNHLGEMGSGPKGICTVRVGPLPSLSHDMLLMVIGSQGGSPDLSAVSQHVQLRRCAPGGSQQLCCYPI